MKSTFEKMGGTSESCGRWSTGENGYSGASDDGEAGHYGRIESLWPDGMGQSGKWYS